MSKQTAAQTSAEYQRLKAQHPDAIILQRTANEYVAFGRDAQQAAIAVYGIDPKIACEMGGGITEYSCPIDALDTVLPRLVRAGNRVAICEE